jgi:hypothetical protein
MNFLSPHPPLGYVALRNKITGFLVDFCFPNSPTVVKLNHNPSIVSEIEAGSNHKNPYNLCSKVVLVVVDYVTGTLE